MKKLVLAAVAALFLIQPALRAGEEAKIPNPLENLKAGQWVRYRINTLFGPAEQKQTVTAIQGEGEDRIISMRSEMIMDDEVVDVQENSVTFKRALEEQTEALSDAKDLRVSRDEVDLKGRMVPCVRVDFIQEDRQNHLYMTDLVPITGMVRLVIADSEEPAMELVDFGE